MKILMNVTRIFQATSRVQADWADLSSVSSASFDPVVQRGFCALSLKPLASMDASGQPERAAS